MMKIEGNLTHEAAAIEQMNIFDDKLDEKK